MTPAPGAHLPRSIFRPFQDFESPPAPAASRRGPTSTDWTWFLDTVGRFNPGSGAAMAKWRVRRARALGDRFPAMERRMKDLVHRKLYEIGTAEVKDAARRTPHALGNVRKAEIAFSTDWSTPMPLAFSLHEMMETNGRIPTSREFELSIMDGNGGIIDFLVERYGDAFGLTADELCRDWMETRNGRALKWRAGNAYYSFLKELQTIAFLREAGLRARYHHMLDAEFRVDCMIEGTDVCIEMYVENDTLKTLDGGGRKTLARHMCPNARIVQLSNSRTMKYGSVWLRDDAALADVARRVAGLVEAGNVRPA